MAIVTPRFRLQAYNIMSVVNLALFVLALALANWHSTWLPALLIGLRVLGDHLLARLSFGISFMFFTALHIHQAAGMLEMHFGIFVLLALLIAFRDYLVILTAAATIAVHHLLFMWLQMQDAGVFLVPAQSLSLGIILMHAAFVVVEAAVLIVISRQSYREAVVGQSLFDATEQLLTSDGKVELTHRCADLNSQVIKNFNAVFETLHKTLTTIEQQSATLKPESGTLRDEGDALAVSMRNEMNEVERIAAATEQMSHSIQDVFNL